MKVYFDVCCLSHPFDDQAQERVRLESEAVRFLLRRVKNGDLEWVGSTVLTFEVGRNPNFDTRQQIAYLMGMMSTMLTVTEEDRIRARKLAERGFGPMVRLTSFWLNERARRFFSPWTIS